MSRYWTPPSARRWLRRRGLFVDPATVAQLAEDARADATTSGLPAAEPPTGPQSTGATTMTARSSPVPPPMSNPGPAPAECPAETEPVGFVGGYRRTGVLARGGDADAAQALAELQELLRQAGHGELLELLRREDRALGRLAVSLREPGHAQCGLILPAAWGAVQQMLSTDAHALLPDAVPPGPPPVLAGAG